MRDMVNWKQLGGRMFAIAVVTAVGILFEVMGVGVLPYVLYTAAAFMTIAAAADSVD